MKKLVFWKWIIGFGGTILVEIFWGYGWDLVFGVCLTFGLKGIFHWLVFLVSKKLFYLRYKKRNRTGVAPILISYRKSKRGTLEVYIFRVQLNGLAVEDLDSKKVSGVVAKFKKRFLRVESTKIADEYDIVSCGDNKESEVFFDFYRACEKCGLLNRKSEPPELLSFIDNKMRIKLNGMSRDDLDDRRLRAVATSFKRRFVCVNETEVLGEYFIELSEENLASFIKFDLGDLRWQEREKESWYFGFDGAKHIAKKISDFPHLLVTGTSTFGKSTSLRISIFDFLYNYGDTTEFYFCDFKRVELKSFRKFSTRPIADDYESTKELIDFLYCLMEKRFLVLSKYKVDVGNIDEYREASGDYWKRIVFVIDELADLYKLLQRKEKQELKESDLSTLDKLRSIAKRSRAIGLHMILATQKASSKSICTEILAQCDVKMSFKQAQQSASILVLNNQDAYNLAPIKGRAIVSGYSVNQVQIQVPYLSKDDLKKYIHLCQNSVKKIEEESVLGRSRGTIIKNGTSAKTIKREKSDEHESKAHQRIALSGRALNERKREQRAEKKEVVKVSNLSGNVIKNVVNDFENWGLEI